MKYLLDTDHLSIYQQQSGTEYTILAARLAQCPSDEIALSVVTFHEQVLGCHTYLVRARDTAGIVRGYKMLGRVITDFTTGPVLLYDSQAAAVFAALTAQRVRISTMDLRIAAIALSRGVVLLTRNRADFGKVPGLRTEDWTL